MYFVYKITNLEIEHNVQILMQICIDISFHSYFTYLCYIYIIYANGNFPLFFDIIFTKMTLLLQMLIFAL